MAVFINRVSGSKYYYYINLVFQQWVIKFSSLFLIRTAWINADRARSDATCVVRDFYRVRFKANRAQPELGGARGEASSGRRWSTDKWRRREPAPAAPRRGGVHVFGWRSQQTCSLARPRRGCVEQAGSCLGSRLGPCSHGPQGSHGRLLPWRLVN
jgi:hypothetical protein